MQIIPDVYLGDGVYAHFDGSRIQLDTRAQSIVNVIVLEPEVLEAFDIFRKALKERLEATQEDHYREVGMGLPGQR